MSDGRLLTDGNAGRLVKWLKKRAIDETKEVPEEVQLHDVKWYFYRSWKVCVLCYGKVEGRNDHEKLKGKVIGSIIEMNIEIASY